MDFVLFLVVTAVLIIRPTDFVPGLEAIPLYLIAIVASLITAAPKLVATVTPAALGGYPVAIFMTGILAVSLVVNFARGQVEGGVDFATEYGKIALFLLLLVSVVDTPRRLKSLMKAVVVITLVPISLAILHYDGWMEVPGYVVTLDDGGVDAATGESLKVRRLGASGMFADPNDVTEIINVSLIFSLFALADRRSGPGRFAWLAPVPVFLYALMLTRSRGGLIGLLTGVAVLLASRLGKRRALIVGAVLLPLALAGVGGRQAAISTSEGTGQARIQLWAEAFELMIASPLIGVGTDRLKENIGHVAHNSFIQAGAELGLIGGALYFGTYCYVIATLMRGDDGGAEHRGADTTSTRPYVLAGVACYTMNEMSLTHPFSVFTYLMLGSASAWIRIAGSRVPIPGSRLSGRMVVRTFVLAIAFYAALFIFTKASVRY